MFSFICLLLIPTMVISQETPLPNKIDPILRSLLSRESEKSDVPVEPTRTSLADSILGLTESSSIELDTWIKVLIRGDNLIQIIHQAGGRVGSSLRNIATAEIPLRALESLSLEPAVEYIEASLRNNLLLDSVASATRANQVWSEHGLYGDDVVVIVYDTGIDIDHQDFRNEDGSSRILFLWDQTASTGVPPSELIDSYGAEWVKTQIDDELDGSPAGLISQVDTHGHGTHVTGIAAGNGLATGNAQPDSQYVGIAPHADIIVIKGDFTHKGVMDGLYWAFSKTAAIGKPAVANLSLGSHHGSHDGLSSFELYLDYLTGPGRIIVAAAGNEGEKALHQRISLSSTILDSIEIVLPAYTPAPFSQNDYAFFNYLFINPVDIEYVNETYYVADLWAPSIQVYDSTGIHLFSIGGVGGGPGEYRRPDAIEIDTNSDRLFVRDYSLHRINLYTLSGEFLDTWRIVVPVSGPFPMVFTHSGDLFTYFIHRANQAMIKIESGGSLSDTLWIPRPVINNLSGSFRGGTFQVPFSPAWIKSMGPSGVVFSGYSDEYRINVLQHNQTKFIIERTV